jgi:pyruvate/2-oxoglutarate dehydrogenase complex dihydrolipoamide acyltransferase (E2) component
MFGSTILDVAIGMVFVYLLLSLLCSAINEYIEAKLNYRSDKLWQGIQLLLNGKIADAPPDPEAPQKNAAKGDATRAAVAAAAAAAPGAKAVPAQTHDLASELYQHGLIRALYKGDGKLPSYIPSRTFALALWNMAYEKLKLEGVDLNNVKDLGTIKQAISQYIPNRELSQALVTLVDEAGGDFDRALKNVEDWYDSAMDRVSGWYKRHVQWILLGIGILTAFFINADSVNIARALIQDKTLRDVIVASATEYAKQHGGNATSSETKKNGADSNTANSNTANSNGANSNSSHSHDTKTGNANAANKGNVNANGVNSNAAGGGQVGNVNTRPPNSDESAATGGSANNSPTPAPTPATAPTPAPIQQAYDAVKALGLPISWKLGSNITQDPIRGFPRRGDGGWNILGWLLLKLFGIFLTGLAISQGAPFWFDVLNKFMVIRSTVKPKEKSREEASKDKTN